MTTMSWRFIRHPRLWQHFFTSHTNNDNPQRLVTLKMISRRCFCTVRILQKEILADKLAHAKLPSVSASNVPVWSGKRAAVVLPLCTVDNIDSVLFTLRSKDVPTHKVKSSSSISWTRGKFHFREGCKKTKMRICVAQRSGKYREI